MSLALIAGILSSSLIFLSEAFYVRAILKGETRPSRSAYWVWALVQGLTAGSYVVAGGGWAAGLAVSYAVCFVVVGLLSLKYGDGKWGRLDTGCLVGAVLAGVAWVVTRSEVVALCLLLLTDWLGGVSVILKSWRAPEYEDATAWVLTMLATIINMFAVEGWVVADWVYMGHLLVLNGIITWLVCRKWFTKNVGSETNGIASPVLKNRGSQ